MQSYVRVLRQFVRESRYLIDERAVADAIMTHTRRRRTTRDSARDVAEEGDPARRTPLRRYGR
jgi:hypothetical protein